MTIYRGSAALIRERQRALLMMCTYIQRAPASAVNDDIQSESRPEVTIYRFPIAHAPWRGPLRPVREVPDGPERREGGARGGGGLGAQRGGYFRRRRHPPVRAPEVLFPSVLARGSGAGNAVASALQVGVFELLNTSCPTL